MLLIEYILIGITILYVAEMVFLWRGLERTDTYDRDFSYRPYVSIIVAARNEEENIEGCLTSLLQLDYPQDMHEIIVDDDGSTDNTAAIVRSYEQKFSHVKLIRAEAGHSNLRGKANALAQGVQRSTGEVLMFTDADCTVPSGWVTETVSYYTDGVGAVAGFTFLRTDKLFDGIQALDWFFLLGAAAATAAWNIPLTAIGNNLSTYRSIYDRVGGYQNLPFSVTEDYALVQAIWQTTRSQIRYPINDKTLVQSKPCSRWKELFRQKQRWAVGGLDMVPRGFLIMSVHFAMHLSILTSAFIVSPEVLLTALAAKLFSDALFLWKPIHRFRKYTLLKYFFFFELYYSLYELLLPFIALFSKKVVWKERSFSET